MSVIRISRPKRGWSVSPATVLPGGLLVRLFRLHFNYTVLVDDRSVGQIGDDEVKVFKVDPGQHRLRIRFVLLRRSKEIRMSLEPDEEREFISATSGMGWPTLREASPEEASDIRRSSLSETPKPRDAHSGN
ncbi:MAG: hypothetical protein ACP5P1_15330 [Acidimicrobiales bacterium]